MSVLLQCNAIWVEECQSYLSAPYKKSFSALIGKAIEVYVADIITKSIKEFNHVTDLEETFKVLRHYEMKLNPNKCTFEVRF